MSKMIFGKIGDSAFELNLTDNDNISTPDGHVLMSEERPDLHYIVKDNRDGTGEWIVDMEYYKSMNQFTVKKLIEEASLHISIIQDAIDLELRESGDEDKLKEWKKYRILLNKIDTNSTQDIEWPAKPA